MTRAETLEKARECVCGQRQEDYGSLEDNFRVIANLWAVYKDIPFSTTDVAMMMALLKIARIKSGTGTDDSFVDLAGYAACGAEATSTKEILYNEVLFDKEELSSCIVLFDKEEDAVKALSAMFESVNTYGFVCVGDLVGSAGSYIDTKYGWKNLTGSKVVQKKGRTEYMLQLPEPILLDKENDYE